MHRVAESIHRHAVKYGHRGPLAGFDYGSQIGRLVDSAMRDEKIYFYNQHDAATAALKWYIDNAALPVGADVRVEEPLSIDLIDGGHRLRCVCVPDLMLFADRTLTIIELKSGKDRRTFATATSVQIGFYAFAARTLYVRDRGYAPDALEVQLYHLGDRKTTTTRFEPSELASISRRMLAAARGILSEQLPAKPEPSRCDACPVRGDCSHRAA